MTDSPILPNDKYWIDASRRPLPPEFFRFFRSLLAYVQQTQGASLELAELTARVDALEAGGSADLIGPLSVLVSGSLDSGAVQFRLVNDIGNPGASFCYSTDVSGIKGWNLLAVSALSDVDLTGLTDGDTLIWDATGMKWEPGGVLTNPMTTLGDIITGDTGGTPKRLGVGSSGQVLTVVSGEPAWAAAGGVGGNFSKVAEVAITTPQQDIDFSSLDLNTARFYQIEIYMVPNVSGSQNVSYYFNGDTTNANYQRQLLFANNASTFVSRANDAQVLTSNAMPTTATSLYGTLKTAKYTGVRPSTTLVCQIQDTTNIMALTGSHVWSSTANVTSIKLRHSSNFGVGTIARLYTLT